MGDNADQLDADNDGVGDDCDPDADSDGIPNIEDNCPLIANPEQMDDDHDGTGDACFRNYDGDSVPDEFDTCPRNAKIDTTDFRAIHPIAMGENTWGQPAPQWEFRNEGKEILQKTNSAPGIAIGSTQMAGMDFEGTFYVGPHELLDNDFIGFIFSFQDSSNFYLVMSARDDRDLVNCRDPATRATGRSSGLEAQPVRTLAQFSAMRSGSSTRWLTRPRCCGRRTSRRQVVGGRGTVTGSTSSIGRR